MVSIASLLNPIPRSFQGYREKSSPCSSDYASKPSSPSPSGKKQKVSKDAAIFAKGKTKGEIRYHPCEIQDAEIAKQHARFQVYPMGHIEDYCRHIPYNSEKKSFLEKTGRESFEVFQYTFRVPGDDREYTVMWDYNIGLVRVTPFFKSCKYSKTTPAKVLNNNPGLRDITHSITGGALAAQGYWMPYEAAKAVAATFCYNIRYALTPVFGVDFLSLCVPPEDPSFGRMLIDRDVVQRCTEQATGYRLISRESSLASSPRSPALSDGFKKSNSKSLRPKLLKSVQSESGYGTDSDRSESYIASPQTPPGAQWVALNTPRSVTNHHYLPSPFSKPVSPFPSQVEPTYRPETPSNGEGNRPAKRLRAEDDETYGEDSSTSRSSASPQMPRHHPQKPTLNSKEARAAYMLMRMHVEDAKMEGTGSRARRAST